MGIVGNSEVTGNVSFQNLPINIERTDEVLGFGDLYPQASLSWNAGVNNYKLYVTGDIQWVIYDPDQLADIGIGHGVIDWGGAYTYLNPETSHELSATLGFTFNFENNRLPERYRMPSIRVCRSSSPRQRWWAGYLYYQLTDDEYPTDTPLGQLREQLLGGFRSKVAAIGPQFAHTFDAGGVPISGGHSVGWSLAEVTVRSEI